MKIFSYITGPIQVNTYLVYDEATNKGFIVDPGDYSQKLSKQAMDLGLEIEYIILTHGHADHIGGVEKFKRDFASAKLVAHEKERDMLGNPALNSSGEMFPQPISLVADIWVKDGDKLQVGNMELKIIHTPGHTMGGMSIYVDGVVFSGDTLFRYSIGRTDFYGGDFSDIMNSIKKRLFALPDDTIVLPGHMQQSTIGDEKKGNPFV